MGIIQSCSGEPATITLQFQHVYGMSRAWRGIPTDQPLVRNSQRNSHLQSPSATLQEWQRQCSVEGRTAVLVTPRGTATKSYAQPIGPEPFGLRRRPQSVQSYHDQEQKSGAID